ncbi:MAG: class I SAM-dependent methyltransferase [Isosphaerales bacterium]
MSMVSPDFDQIARTISPNDEMFHGNEHHYFGVGRSALENIERALAAARSPSSPKRILDMPCGHGRVLRYLRARYPSADITACDLVRDGVDFCARNFAAIPVYSEACLSNLPLERGVFDLVWVGSLLTHFDCRRWVEFLTFFRALLTPGGVLVFSTHGRQAHAWIAGHDRDYGLGEERCRDLCEQFASVGFGYADYPGQSNFGISLSEPAWVCRLLTSLPELRLVGFNEKAWDGHHDVFACVRDADWKVHCTPAPDFPSPRDYNVSPKSPGKSRAPWLLWWKRSA